MLLSPSLSPHSQNTILSKGPFDYSHRYVPVRLVSGNQPLLVFHVVSDCKFFFCFSSFLKKLNRAKLFTCDSYFSSLNSCIVVKNRQEITLIASKQARNGATSLRIALHITLCHSTFPPFRRIIFSATTQHKNWAVPLVTKIFCQPYLTVLFVGRGGMVSLLTNTEIINFTKKIYVFLVQIRIIGLIIIQLSPQAERKY